LRPGTFRYWRTRTKFAGEMVEQELLFGIGQLVYGGFDFGERAHVILAEASFFLTPRACTGIYDAQADLIAEKSYMPSETLEFDRIG